MKQYCNEEQESFTQNQYGGYVGSSYYEHQQSEHSFQQQEYQSAQGFRPSSHGQQQLLPPPLESATLAALLCYSLCWFTGLLILLFGRQNRVVRFHALQSLLFFGSINILDIVLITLIAYGGHHFPLLSVFVILFLLLMNFVAFIGWFVAMIQAARGGCYRLPFVGNLVARWMNLNYLVR